MWIPKHTTKPGRRTWFFGCNVHEICWSFNHVVKLRIHHNWFISLINGMKIGWSVGSNAAPRAGNVHSEQNSNHELHMINARLTPTLLYGIFEILTSCIMSGVFVSSWLDFLDLGRWGLGNNTVFTDTHVSTIEELRVTLAKLTFAVCCSI